MKLVSAYKFDKYKVISIVGAGGKTTFMMTLAKELGKIKRVLITTTTKIYVPQKNSYKEMKIGDPNSLKLDKKADIGIYVYGKAINEENKLIGATEEDLDILKDYFDFIIIESDGSKHKSLKGWNDKEPVVYSETELTVGIIDIQALGIKISRENIHREDIFMELTNAEMGEIVNCEHLTKVVTSENGLFKNSLGKRILFINRIEEIKYNNLAHELVSRLNKETHSIECFILGSLKEKVYKAVF